MSPISLLQRSRTPLTCLKLSCLLAVTAIASLATPITTTETLRADFDLTGLTPASPYEMLRTRLTLDNTDRPDWLQVGGKVFATVYNSAGVAISGLETYTNIFATPINSISGFDLAPLLSGAKGFILFSFTQEVDVTKVEIVGSTDGTLTIPTLTHWSTASLSVVSGAPEPPEPVSGVPEPGAFLTLASGLGLLGLCAAQRARRRRCGRA